MKRWLTLRDELATAAQLTRDQVTRTMYKLRRSGAIDPKKNPDDKNALYLTDEHADILSQRVLAEGITATSPAEAIPSERAVDAGDEKEPTPKGPPEGGDGGDPDADGTGKAGAKAGGAGKKQVASVSDLADSPGPPNTAAKKEPKPKADSDDELEDKPRFKMPKNVVLIGVLVVAGGLVLYYMTRNRGTAKPATQEQATATTLPPAPSREITAADRDVMGHWRDQFGMEVR